MDYLLLTILVKTKKGRIPSAPSRLQLFLAEERDSVWKVVSKRHRQGESFKELCFLLSSRAGAAHWPHAVHVWPFAEFGLLSCPLLTCCWLKLIFTFKATVIWTSGLRFIIANSCLGSKKWGCNMNYKLERKKIKTKITFISYRISIQFLLPVLTA